MREFRTRIRCDQCGNVIEERWESRYAIETRMRPLVDICCECREKTKRFRKEHGIEEDR